VHLDYKERYVVGTPPQSCNADNEVRWSRIRNRMMALKPAKTAQKGATSNRTKSGGGGEGQKARILL
jgi:hypothetical protein